MKIIEPNKGVYPYKVNAHNLRELRLATKILLDKLDSIDDINNTRRKKYYLSYNEATAIINYSRWIGRITK